MNPINARKNAMNKRNQPATVDEHFAQMDERNGAQPPAKLSKLSAAMQVVSANATQIEALGAEIDALHVKYAPNTVWDLETKEGAAECDLARKDSRAVRLKIQNLRDQGKSLLNSLKGELVTAAESDIARAQAIEDNAKSQQEAKARKEQDRIDRHEKNITAIALMAEGIGAMTSAEIAARIDALTAILVDESYEEFQSKALRKHREVADVLAAASFVAAERERAAQEAEERAAAAAKELADLQARQAEAQAKETERLRVKGLIDAIKRLPSEVEGTDLANVREVLRIHKLAEPKADVFGDQLEMAELVHFKVTKELEELEYMLGMAEEAPAEPRAMDVMMDVVAAIPPQAIEAAVVGIDMGTDERSTPEPEGSGWGAAAGTAAIDEEPLYEDSPLPARTVAAQQSLSTPAADPDPFSAPAPRPRLAPRGVPAVGPVVATPEGDRGPIADVGAIMDAIDAHIAAETAEPDVPDLLKAAQDFIMTAEEMCGWHDHDNTPDALIPLFAALKAAVDFTTEFAD
jgi:hypothetical protein